MAKIGIIGLGKLGLPVALAIESRGHEVFGWDTSFERRKDITDRIIREKEEGAQELLNKTNIELKVPEWIIENCDITFLAIQTPHDPMYEGITRIPHSRADFDYSFLQEAVKELKPSKIATLVIISTVLPTTIETKIKPLLHENIRLCYNPFFIAMGTVIHDFLNPEFVLLGVDDKETADQVQSLYTDLYGIDWKNNPVPIMRMPIVDAELTKVSYNTFIGMKIAFVNTLMEICAKIGGNVDNVTDALKMAKDRLISTKYLTAGMGDGGGCHPRDNIAMSFLAKELTLSHNIFEDIMVAREYQTEWLATITVNVAVQRNLPIVILGKAFKPETNLTVGSPAILLKNLINQQGYEVTQVDPFVDGINAVGEPTMKPAIFFIGTMHDVFTQYVLPKGSVIIDPFAYMPDQDGVEVYRVGRK